MNVLIRCDSSFSIGSGHVFRCISFAQLLKNDVTFVCRKLEGNINTKITQDNFKLIELEGIPNYQNGDPLQEEDEIHKALDLIQPDVVIVDHYGLDASWETVVKAKTKFLLAIDDLGREHNSDGILDQNFRLSIPSNYLNSKSKLFLGPNYCLLNQNFLQRTAPSRDFYSVENILVFFGGSDSASMTLRVLKLIGHFEKEISWEIVVGEQNRDLKDIEILCAKMPNVKLHVNINYMDKLMVEADLFLGAGGTTTWERAKLGLPSIVVSIADNQIEINKYLHAKEIIYYIGKSSEVSDKQITKTVLMIKNNSKLREVLSKNSLGLEVSSKLNDLISYVKSYI